MPTTITALNPTDQPYQTSSNPAQTTPADQRGIPVISDLHARYFQQALNLKMFHAQSAVGGVSIPAPSTVNSVCALWNLAGSGVYVVVTSVAISYVSGTTAPGGIFMSFATGLGSQAATGSPITVFTHVDPFSAIIGQPYPFANKVRFAPATSTFTTAMAQGIYTGISYGAVTAAVTNGPQYSGSDLEGAIIVPPGAAIAPVAIVLTTALYNVRISYYVVPAPNSNG